MYIRAYILIFAFVLLPYLVVSRPGQQHINKVFARRTRASPRYVGSAPRQVRFSRYIQEPELQEVQQQQQNLDDVDLEGELEPQQQLTETGYGAEKGTTKSNGFLTQAPLYETSTARPVQKQQVQQQMKDDDEELSQLSQPLQQSEFEDVQLSQNYMPTQELSYSPMKQTKERNGNGQRLAQQSYGGNGGSASYGGPSYGGSASGNSELGPMTDAFDFGGDDDSSMGSIKDSVRGEPGQDYPVFSSVPETGFKCSQQQYPGYYADVEAQCQVFHICQEDGRANGFLCPNGTIFSQRHFVCVWWFDFDCSTAEQFYDLNAELYKESELGSSPRSGQGQGGSIYGGSVPSEFSDELIGGSVPSSNGLIGGSVPSPKGLSGKLHSPKENLNKMYMAQIDEFSSVTTTAPSYYSNGKTSNGKTSNGKTTQRKNGNGNGGFKGLTTPSVQQYESQSVESVTPSSFDGQNYETTPYNLDEALGEEIHSDSPILEALSLTTNVPKMQSSKSYGPSAMKGGNGNRNNNFYGTTKSNPKSNYGSSKTSQLADFGFGEEMFTSPKPSYGSKDLNKPNGKTSPKQGLSQLPEAPVKSSRNGGSTKSTKSMYGGNGNGKSLKSPVSNGFKSYSSPSSYGTKH